MKYNIIGSNKMKKLALIMFMGIALSACSNTSKLPQTVQSINDVAPYPEASTGYTRYAIHLPKLTDENSAKVEVLVGKEMNVDCNFSHLATTLKQEELKGWGYNYYVVDKVYGEISTLMACPVSTNKNQFVTANLSWLDYNSRLPIVLYVPNDLQVKYRIWQPNAKILQANAE
jgi:ecotin